MNRLLRKTAAAVAIAGACVLGADTVLAVPAPTVSWQAEDYSGGDWDPSVGDAGMVWVKQGSSSTKESGTSNLLGVNDWVSSPNFLLQDPAPGNQKSFQDILGNAVTQANASWEFVIRPGDFVGKHSIFDTGGNGDGTALVLDGSTLEFRFQDANSATQRVTLDVSGLNANEFIHVVATVDVDTSAAGTGALYVNGALASGPTTSPGVINDWDGGDNAGLGVAGNNNIPDGNPFNGQAFTGDIAVVNFYGGEILTAQDASDAYAALGALPMVMDGELTNVLGDFVRGTDPDDFYGIVSQVSPTIQIGGTNVNAVDATLTEVGDYLLQSNAFAGIADDTVLATLDLTLPGAPAGSFNFFHFVEFRGTVEEEGGTLESDDAIRFEVYDPDTGTVFASQIISDDLDGTADFLIRVGALDRSVTNLQGRIVYAGGFETGTEDAEEYLITDFKLVGYYATAPEPATAALGLLTVAGLAMRRRRSA